VPTKVGRYLYTTTGSYRLSFAIFQYFAKQDSRAKDTLPRSNIQGSKLDRWFLVPFVLTLAFRKMFVFIFITFDGSEAYQSCSQTSPRHRIAQPPQSPAPHRNRRPWFTRPCDTTDNLGMKYGSTATITLSSDCHTRPLEPLEEPVSSPWNYTPTDNHQTRGAAAIVDHSTLISSLVLDSEEDDSIPHVRSRGLNPAPGGQYICKENDLYPQATASLLRRRHSHLPFCSGTMILMRR